LHTHFARSHRRVSRLRVLRYSYGALLATGATVPPPGSDEPDRTR
jgi:hypothetical protein